MASDPLKAAPPSKPVVRREKGIRIFTYPKIIFIFPTLIAALICGFGMLFIGNKTEDPIKTTNKNLAVAKGGDVPNTPMSPAMAKHERFTAPQNLFGVLFLAVLAFNLVIMAIDFPRFTIVAIILLVLFGIFFILWIGAYFDYDLMKSVRAIMGSIYAVANAEFYFLVALILTVVFGMIYATRYLDYWEILPNEILHHHGPLSDLERYPTMNLKFDKEIPDVFEHLFLGAGRLVLHMADERKSVVLENVLFITSVENALKSLMSRMEVRLSPDQDSSGVPQ